MFYDGDYLRVDLCHETCLESHEYQSVFVWVVELNGIKTFIIFHS